MTRAKPVGHEASQPRPLTNDAMPICMLLPFLWTVNGPPESPLHAPRTPSPDVQTLKRKFK